MIKSTAIRTFLKEVLNNEDYETTWSLEFGYEDGTRWALVASWMDYDGDGDWKPYAKLACQPNNSAMQEYDIDWMMPTDEDGNVDDTEIQIGGVNNIDDCVGWFMQEMQRFEDEYVKGK